MPPFETIQAGDFEGAIDIFLKLAKENFEKVAENCESPTFANTIKKMEMADRPLSSITAIYFNLISANSTRELEDMQEDIVAKLTKFKMAVLTDARIYNRIRVLYNDKESLNLTYEEKRVIELYYRNFIRSGAKLKISQKRRLTFIMKRLSELGTKFSKNILEEERNWKLELSENDLIGLSNDLISSLKQSGLERNVSAPVLTLSRSHLVPFLESSPNQVLREKSFKAWVSRGLNSSKNNKAIVSEILELRAERAKLIGFRNFSEFKLEPEMAKKPETVKTFLMELWKIAKVKASEESKILMALKREDNEFEELQPWDWRYYESKLRNKTFGVDSSDMKSFFKLENIREAAFSVAYNLFNLEFVSVSLSLYHEDAQAWEVKREGVHVGIFIADYFARPSKRSGAWCSTLRSQSKFNGPISPIVLNVCNFAKPTKYNNALLTFDDALTLFHEFGHALHNLLSNVNFDIISGTSVARDFVELPSQLYEHWLTCPYVLENYIIHEKTGKKFPKKVLDSIKLLKKFGSGFSSVEYLASAIVDLELHSANKIEDPLIMQESILKKLGMPIGIVMRHSVCNFAHIFSGDGYSSGYYSYIWSEVMDADAFEAFEEKGNFFDSELAKKLELYIYGSGGSRPPEELYELFRGRLPTINALLKGRGLL